MQQVKFLLIANIWMVLQLSGDEIQLLFPEF